MTGAHHDPAQTATRVNTSGARVLRHLAPSRASGQIPCLLCVNAVSEARPCPNRLHGTDHYQGPLTFAKAQ